MGFIVNFLHRVNDTLLTQCLFEVYDHKPCLDLNILGLGPFTHVFSSLESKYVD